MAEFHVVLDGVDLDEAKTRAINDDIQKVVLSHLADIDMTSGREHKALVAMRLDPEWLGIWLRAVRANLVLDNPDLAPNVDRLKGWNRGG